MENNHDPYSLFSAAQLAALSTEHPEPTPPAPGAAITPLPIVREDPQLELPLGESVDWDLAA